MASRTGRIARRSLLGGAALLLASQAGRAPVCVAPADDPLRQEVTRFLTALGQDGTSPFRLRPVLASLQRGLPPALLAEAQAAADASCVSPDDCLAYNTVEALPVSGELVSLYLPRGVAFLMRRQARQGALLGAAFLKASEPWRWEVAQGWAGLHCGNALGVYVGVNNGLALLSLPAPAGQWLGPGVPAGLAGRLLLEQAGSMEIAQALLESLQPCRACRCMLYDTVEGTGQLYSTSASWQGEAVKEPVNVLATPGEDASANVKRLSAALQANLGWLSADKAIGLLERALPGATCLALDLEERLCLISAGAAVSASRY